MKMKNRKTDWKIVISVIVVLLISISIFSFVLYMHFIRLPNSEPCQFAYKYIENNPTIISNLGKIKKQSISRRDGYSLTYNEYFGGAQFSVFIEGENKNGLVSFDLQKLEGTWEVLNANLILKNNKQISLVE